MEQTESEVTLVNAMVRTVDREEKEVRLIISPDGNTLSTTLLTEDGLFMKFFFVQGSS